MCVDHLTFFINPPESGVGAAVFQAGVLPFIHIYNVPVISGDGHGEQDEAEQPAQTRTDDNCPKVHFHQIKSLLWFIEFERLLLPFSSSEARRVSFKHIKAHHSVFITPVVSRVKEESALSTCWMKKLWDFPRHHLSCTAVSGVRADPLNTESTRFSLLSFSCDHSLWFILSPQRRARFSFSF